MKNIFWSKAANFLVLAAVMVPVKSFAYKAGDPEPDNATVAALEEAYDASAAFLGEAYNEAFPPSTNSDGGQIYLGAMEIMLGGFLTTVGVAENRVVTLTRPGIQNTLAHNAAVRMLPELEEARSLVAQLSPQDRAAMEALYRSTLELDPEYRAARGLPPLSAEERTRLEAALDADSSATRRQAIVLATHQGRVDALNSNYAEVRQRELERILAGSNLNSEEKQTLRRLAGQRRGGWFAIAAGLGLVIDGGLRSGAAFAQREPGISPAYNFGAAVVKAAVGSIVGSDEAAPAAAGARGN